MVDLINKFALFFFKNNVQYATQAMSRVEKYNIITFNLKGKSPEFLIGTHFYIV